MARKSKMKRSAAETKPTAHPEPNTESVPTNYVEAIRSDSTSVEDVEFWLSTLMGGPDWERQVDAFSDETC